MITLLDTPLLTIATATGRQQVGLADALARLCRQEVLDFPKLRPHQRHIWHAFLVQAAVLALAGSDDPLPDEADIWRHRLMALTGDRPDGWALFAPPDQPAFFQPPLPGGDLAGFKPVRSPDQLDMLVSAKNHDLKGGSIDAADLEAWIYALVSLQTQDGFLGAGNYGISRMNGGFGNRPGLGIDPGQGLSGRFCRDVARLRAMRGELLRDYPYRTAGGLGLLWLCPWDGTTSLSPSDLDPFYIDICRRVRLTEGIPLRALVSGSRVPRVDAGSLKGVTGDPWTPLMPDKDGWKALTLDVGGFSYRRLVPLLFPRVAGRDAARPAPLQDIGPSDPPDGLVILARACVRGQGKTEGFHERRVPVSRVLRRALDRRAGTIGDLAAHCAHQRVQDAGDFSRRVLYPALMAAITGAPPTDGSERSRDDDTAKSRAARFLKQFDLAVDGAFFPALDRELALLDDPAGAQQERSVWLWSLYGIGEKIVDRAVGFSSGSAARDWRRRVRARDILTGCFRRQFGDRVAATPSDRSPVTEDAQP